MTPISTILLGADAALLARVGRPLRERDHATFVATDAADARKLARRHPSALVLAVIGDVPGFEELGSALRARRPAMEIACLGADDGPAAVLAALDAAIARAGVAVERRRLEVMLKRRTRQLETRGRSAGADAGSRTRKLAEANLRLREQVHGLGRLIALVAECGEGEMSGHADQVARTSVMIGRQMGLSPQDLDELRLAALLHDVGRMGVKGGDEGEDGHAERGARMLAALPLPAAVIAAVKHHHEHHDGSGAPSGWRGSQIPLLARILAVADAHARLVHGEPGSQPLTDAEAIEFMRMSAGSAHDPDIVEALAGCLVPDARALAGVAP